MNFNETEKNFLKKVNERIDEYIKNLPEKYLDFLQLKNGNRFRPLLVYYGYTLNSLELNENVINISYAIELIHKASTIIDDIIDEDTKRRELDACHIQYSTNEAIVLSIHMLGEAIENIYGDINLNNIIGKTIKNMCVGTLHELNMSQNHNVDEIKNIINNQTTCIIMNCLLLGYSLSAKNNDFSDIEILGSKLGYLFQALNDCESIFNNEFINKNKGNDNFDYNKVRKNICVTYLQVVCKKKEIKDLSKMPFDYLLELIDTYNIKNYILEEISFIKEDIYSILERLSNSHNVKRISEFITFTIQIAEKRANMNK